jgi:hypothetical protein
VGKEADFWGVLVEELESCAEIFHTDLIIAGNGFREGTASASISPITLFNIFIRTFTDSL